VREERNNMRLLGNMEDEILVPCRWVEHKHTYVCLGGVESFALWFDLQSGCVAVTTWPMLWGSDGLYCGFQSDWVLGLRRLVFALASVVCCTQLRELRLSEHDNALQVRPHNMHVS
jgi:hypothetical protein